MPKSGNLADVRNYLYDQVESRYWWSLGLSLGVQILSLIAVFINQTGFLFLIGFLAFITPIIVVILRESASELLQKADKCRRLILYADALGSEIPEADLVTITGWTIGIKLTEAPFTPPYYLSNLSTGSQRLVDIVAESAFFTNFLAGKVANYLGRILFVSVLLVSAILYFAASLNLRNTNLNEFQLAAKVGLFIISSVLLGEIYLLWKKYSELQSSAQETFKRCSELRNKSNLPIEEAMQTVEDYNLVLIQSPPIPLKVYLKYRDKLNESYRDSYQINPHQP